MKKTFAVSLVLSCLISLVGCNNNTMQTPTTSLGENYDITLSAKDVSDTGLTLVFNNPSLPAGSISTGRAYTIQVYEDSEWEDVQPHSKAIFFTDALVPKENTWEIAIDWEPLYGQLSAGKYRISKHIDISFGSIGVSVDTRTEDNITLWAEFEIAE